ncbi:MAG: choice-of-anchor R domain-containing protein [bacterium]|nr:choice-of-anchor R domain-containing protein [bacterium]
MKKTFFKKNQNTLQSPHTRGAALMLTVLFMLIISVVIVLGSASPLVLDLKNAQDLYKSKASYYSAETAMEDIFYRFKKGKIYEPSPRVLSVNGGTVSVQTTSIGSFEKEIVATSDISSRLRKAKLNAIQGVGSDFSFGAQIGDGGLVMAENSEIRGVGGAVGNVFSNGPIVGANGTKITGTAIVATGVVLDPVQQSTVYNLDTNVGKNSTDTDYAQQFTAGETGGLYRVSLYLKKTGTPSGTNDIRIVSDNGSNSPLTTSLAGVTLSPASVGTSYGWIDFTLSTPVSVVSGQKYWIILNAGTNSTSNYWTWGSDSTFGYTGGSAKYKSSWSTGGSWTAVSQDLNFKVYYGAGPGTITNLAHIYVDAHANTITGSTIDGIAYCQTGSGNSKSCNTSLPDPIPGSMSITDGNIAQWKTEATAGGVINNSCPGTGCSLSMGPKKIVGDLTISNPFTITGILYVTGHISVNANLKCHADFGASSCIILADGWIETSNGVNITGSGTAGSYVLLVSTIAGCNGAASSTCTPNDDAGIEISNNVTGGIYFTTASMISMSNNASVKAVTGYKLNLQNNAIIQYETGIANTLFSSGPAGGWNVGGWKEVQ